MEFSRTPSVPEIREVLRVCRDDRSATGKRDAAMLAVAAEVLIEPMTLRGLRLRDFDAGAGTISVLARDGERRAARLSADAAGLVRRWIDTRGDAPGVLFCSVAYDRRTPDDFQHPKQLGPRALDEAIALRCTDAGVEPFKARGLRQSVIADLAARNELGRLAAGV